MILHFRPLPPVLFLAAAVMASACQQSTGTSNKAENTAGATTVSKSSFMGGAPVKSRRQIVVQVAANQVTCSGAFGPRQCLVVTFPDRHTETLSDGIHDYKHTNGKPARLLVERMELDTSNPTLIPQDISSIQYRLIKRM